MRPAVTSFSLEIQNFKKDVMRDDKNYYKELYKYEQAYTVKNYQRTLFNVNELPIYVKVLICK